MPENKIILLVQKLVAPLDRFQYLNLYNLYFSKENGIDAPKHRHPYTCLTQLIMSIYNNFRLHDSQFLSVSFSHFQQATINQQIQDWTYWTPIGFKIT